MGRNSLKNVFRLIAEQSQPPEKAFLSDLKRSMELTEEKNKREPSKTYKPSSMNCIRNMYYQVTGHETDKGNANACLIGICESGTDRHERIQNAVSEMKNNDIDCEYIDVGEYVKSRELNDIEVVTKQGNETKLFHKTLNMSFLCDGIVKYNGHYYILEIKTESIYKWQPRKDVADEHKMQGTAYSTTLGIDEVIFLYVNRDNADMKTFMFVPTQEMKDTFVKRIEECNEYINKLTIPPISENVPKKACEYCNYRKSCKAESD